jgi:hypothetical protein
MTAQIEFRGKSGAAYRYSDMQNGKVLPGTAGNFVFVRDGAQGATLVYAGETNDLLTGMDDGWAEAVSRHGATHRLMRLNVSSQTRRDEQVDLVEAHNPPMNPPSDESKTAAS